MSATVRRWPLVVAVAWLLALAPAAHAGVVAFPMGDASIQVPIESGYVAVSEHAPELHRFGQAALPPSNRLVDTFYTAADLKALQQGEMLNGHYFMIQTMRSLEPLQVSVADWQRMQPDITSGMVDALAGKEIHNDAEARDARMSEAAGRDVAMRFGELTAPEIYAKTPDSIRFLMNIPAVFEVGGETREVAVGAAGAIVLVQNKLVFVYWYAVPATPDTIDVARRKLDTTVEGMVALNASDASVASSRQLSGGIEWGRFGTKALVGAAVAVLVLLGGLLLARRK
ncbi:hypothetical protein [Arenimonas alkanexedens]